MEVIVAPDKFAGTLSAGEAAAAIADGWARGRPGDRVARLPLADGGPGFLDALQSATAGRRHPVATTGPLGAPVTAHWLEVDGTGYVEAAQACGLDLVAAGRRDPIAASTAGLSAVLADLLQAGMSRAVVGIGGTATTDGGAGLVRALPGWPAGIDLLVATDVDNPLLGPDGAAAGFGPQKGADPEQVAELEQRLAAWAAETGGDPQAPGAGAGGGLGYGLMLLGGRRVSGADLVVDLLLPVDRVAAADLVITGEGSLDWQSLRGKLVSAVARRCGEAARPCAVLAGRDSVGRREAAAAGIAEVRSVADRFGVAAAMAAPGERLADLAAEFAAAWRG